MKKRFLTTAIAVLALLTSSGKGVTPSDYITFESVDPMVKVLREMNYFGNFKDTIDVAKGESATFQFAIRAGLPIKGLSATVTFSDGKNVLKDISVGFVEYARAGNPNPEPGNDALRPASLYYPDPVHVVGSVDVKRDITQPIWIRVNVPKEAVAGLYKGKITVKGELAGESFVMNKEMDLKVYNVVLNDPRLWVTNWYAISPAAIETFYGKPYPIYSEQYWNLLEESAKKMAHCYQNATIIPMNIVDFKVKNGKYSFDFTNFDKTIAVFDKYGVAKMINGGHIAGRVGDWASKFGVQVPTGEINKHGLPVMKYYAPDHDSSVNFIKQYIPAMVEHLKAKGWYDRYTQHIADEPTGDNTDSYIAIAKLVKQQAGDIKIIDACHSKDLENTVDIWVPQLNFYQEGIDFYKERQKSGDQVWFYTCLAPQGNYVNRFLEQPLMKTRLIHWLNYRFGATGYLHWGLYYWGKQDAYERTTGLNRESGNTLPGGDCWIVYPDHGTMHGSIRLDAMRDGVADNELLRMLEAKNKPLADELCRQMVYNWTVYELEPYRLREIRRTILNELSK